nr:MAG TPA: hypothetical protein [Caudoviricetes sp.]
MTILKKHLLIFKKHIYAKILNQFKNFTFVTVLPLGETVFLHTNISL